MAQESVGTNHLTANLQLMTHGEIRNGGLSDDAGDNQSNFVMGRSRLIIDFDKPWLDARLNIQHQGIWGQKNKGVMNVYEAWARVHSDNGLFLQVGRHVLAYDDERILGPNDWAMAGLSHDGLKLGYEGKGHKVHAMLAYNQNAENINNGSTFYEDGALPYKTMQTLWYHYDIPTMPLGASLLMMNVGMQGGDKDKNERTEWQQLVGGYVKYALNHWSIEGSYYRQMGHNEEGIKMKAWMASVSGTLTPADSYGFVGGFDFLSGEKYFVVPQKKHIGVIRHEVIRGFSPVYGSHHKFYGAMDFFYLSSFVSNFSPGLQNAYIGGFVKPLKGLKADVKYHYLAMGTKLEGLDMTLGHELELQATYKLMKEATLSLGFTYMAGTETMERLKRSSARTSLRWGWITLNVNPRIFSTKW